MRVALIAMIAIALSACAGRAPRETLPAIAGSPDAHQDARVAAIGALPGWSMSGRVAVSNGKDGGSGRIEWKQTGERFDVALSAPVTRQSWRVTGGEGEAMLEGLSGGPRSGPDAGELVFEATRWRIPVDALSDWMMATTHFNGRTHYGADGRVDRIDENGWVVTYADWAAVEAGGMELPGRIEATQGDARVRLVVDRWSLGAQTQ
ncbi:lipoprotein insertase outer membrane protein LolB [Noviluteimonas gilva]|uniref:Outer-membrane lipoprotein LolB n=1 Tax=Noviluteimonas gilva TaxID=2682097 RepID=A0A7C9M389_9GAMM|nr:lipoprotein insertase outer membrane protein LolB [Lysobacter gilvus]MUV13922.1 outer membrane lipoprotein LolB [Lysobacter gilvus]